MPTGRRGEAPVLPTPAPAGRALTATQIRAVLRASSRTAEVVVPWATLRGRTAHVAGCAVATFWRCGVVSGGTGDIDLASPLASPFAEIAVTLSESANGPFYVADIGDWCAGSSVLRLTGDAGTQTAAIGPGHSHVAGAMGNNFGHSHLRIGVDTPSPQVVVQSIKIWQAD